MRKFSKVELQKHFDSNGGFQTYSTPAYYLSSKFLPLGGSEGRKKLVTISQEKSLLRAILRGNKQKYLIKEYNIAKLATVKKIIVANRKLFKKGYLVPPTMRILLDNNSDYFYLLMTEMTYLGRYRIWGWSLRMTDEQFEELQAMNISVQDEKIIRKKAYEFVLKTTQDKIRLSQYDTIHIFQDTTLSQFEFGLLDFRDDIFDETAHEKSLLRNNIDAMNIWFISLRDATKRKVVIQGFPVISP